MLVYFIKEILICILLSSLIIGAGHYAVYIFEHNKNINYPIKSDSETLPIKLSQNSYPRETYKCQRWKKISNTKRLIRKIMKVQRQNKNPHLKIKKNQKNH